MFKTTHQTPSHIHYTRRTHIHPPPGDAVKANSTSSLAPEKVALLTSTIKGDEGGGSSFGEVGWGLEVEVFVSAFMNLRRSVLGSKERGNKSSIQPNPQQLNKTNRCLSNPRRSLKRWMSTPPWRPWPRRPACSSPKTWNDGRRRPTALICHPSLSDTSAPPRRLQQRRRPLPRRRLLPGQARGRQKGRSGAGPARRGRARRGERRPAAAAAAATMTHRMPSPLQPPSRPSRKPPNLAVAVAAAAAVTASCLEWSGRKCPWLISRPRPFPRPPNSACTACMAWGRPRSEPITTWCVFVRVPNVRAVLGDSRVRAALYFTHQQPHQSNQTMYLTASLPRHPRLAAPPHPPSKPRSGSPPSGRSTSWQQTRLRGWWVAASIGLFGWCLGHLQVKDNASDTPNTHAKHTRQTHTPKPHAPPSRSLASSSATATAPSPSSHWVRFLVLSVSWQRASHHRSMSCRQRAFQHHHTLTPTLYTHTTHSTHTLSALHHPSQSINQSIDHQVPSATAGGARRSSTPRAPRWWCASTATSRCSPSRTRGEAALHGLAGFGCLGCGRFG
jgi:hypothetical protein